MPDGATPVLELDDVHVFYGKVEALRGLSFTVNDGEIVTLIGANGAGKSTTLKTISGVRPLSRGHIRFQGRDIRHVAPYRRVEEGICQAPEGRGIFPGMSVRENLDMGAYARRGKGRGGLDEDRDRVFSLFPRLKERSGQMGGTLSGGEQQMLALSRAVSTQPTLLLLDELSMGLAPLIVTQMYDTVRELADEGLSILVAEQFARTVLPIAHSAGIMLHGRIVRMGSPSKIEEELSTHYLGG